MTDVAELAFEGVPLVVDHYDKVYDPLRNKTKQGVQKFREMRQRRDRGYESEDDYVEEYDDPPHRRTRSGGGRVSPRDELRRRADRGSVVEERYAHRGPPRASSVGRDRGRNRYYKGETISRLGD